MPLSSPARAASEASDAATSPPTRELPDGGRIEAVVTGDREPGYGSASKMIAESALCLVRDVQGEGGIWTPGALMGPALRRRLTERAGLTFSAR